jgi:hypothetical protein
VQAQEEQSLRQGQEIELASDQALVGQFPPDSSQYQFYQQQISLLDLELGNEAGALEAAQNAENAGTAQEQFIVQSEQGLHPPLPYNPASGPPVPQPSLLQAQEALGQQPTLQALQAALNAPVQLQAEQQQYYNYLRQVASGLGGVPASTVGRHLARTPLMQALVVLRAHSIPALTQRSTLAQRGRLPFHMGRPSAGLVRHQALELVASAAALRVLLIF